VPEQTAACNPLRPELRAGQARARSRHLDEAVQRAVGAGGAGDNYRLEPHAGGTRFTFEHTGFADAGGFFMAKLLGRVRTKMLTVGLPAVLDDMN
jgi:hypothetical protein